MPKVLVKLFASLRDIVGEREVRIEVAEGATVKDVLDAMIRRYGSAFKRQVVDPATEELQSSIRVLVNGRDVSFLKGLKTKVGDDDTVAILPPVGGG